LEISRDEVHRIALLARLGIGATLEQIGGEAVDSSLPLTEYGYAAYCVPAPAKASSNLARYDLARPFEEAPPA